MAKEAIKSVEGLAYLTRYCYGYILKIGKVAKNNINNYNKIMPGFNGRGPMWGGGPGAGWGRGPCGAGWDWHRGWGRGWGYPGSGNYPSYGPTYPYSPQPPTLKEEKEMLNEDLQVLREEMKAIEQRMKELETKKGKK